MDTEQHASPTAARNRLICFVTLAYGFSLAWWVPLAVSGSVTRAGQGWLPMTTSTSSVLAGWRRAMVVIAHPDDESFGPGAVIGTLIAEGCEVGVLCFTHGEASTLGTSVDLATISATELRDAASELGIADVTLDHHPDARL